jgi:hypothetical protein
MRDTGEDGTSWTFALLERQGFDAEVIAALELVTKLPKDDGKDLET